MQEIMGMPQKAKAAAMNFGQESIVTSALCYENSFAILESNSGMPYCRPFDIGFELVFEDSVVCFDANYGEFTREEFAIYKNGKSREVLSLNNHDEYEEAMKHLLFCLTNNIKSDVIDIEHAINSVKIKEMVIDSLEMDEK
jgi:hypothetical protein